MPKKGVNKMTDFKNVDADALSPVGKSSSKKQSAVILYIKSLKKCSRAIRQSETKIFNAASPRQ